MSRAAVLAAAVVALAGCAGGQRTDTGGEMGRVADGPRERLDRSVPPDVGPPPSMALPEIRRFTLANGLPVVLVEQHELPIVSVEIQLRGGSAGAGAVQAGLAALVADMLDEGAARPDGRERSALEISADVERMGAALATTAGFDASQLELTVLRPRLEEALGVLADVLLRPTFPRAELERVKNERVTRVVQDLDEPRALANNAFAMVLYGEEHPWGWPLLGSRETLDGLDREDVVGFWKARYTPELATVVVSGAVEEAELRALLQARFGGWTGPAAPSPLAELPDVPRVDEPTIFLVDRPGAAQSEIRVGRVAVSRATEDYFPLTVLNTVLGGSFTSRLNSKLREEKGYTYGAGSGFSMRTRPGPFLASSAVHTPVTDSAVVEFLREIRRIREERVPEAELERAKRYVAYQLPQRFETVADLTARLSEMVLYDLPRDYYASYVERVLGVTAAEVQEAARTHLDPDRMVVVVAGDREVVEAPLRALGMPVVVLPAEPGAPPKSDSP